MISVEEHFAYQKRHAHLHLNNVPRKIEYFDLFIRSLPMIFGIVRGVAVLWLLVLGGAWCGWCSCLFYNWMYVDGIIGVAVLLSVLSIE